ncbi:LysE family translocator [Colwellia hornerae]|uniref:LysE family translocator n=1 Tax=Colwellia hornerae TaxID=89402 RepID=A0A5C6QBM1_9GAMM|nr:LysE family translocator [Colwellia hornerae]TWX53002.1 LysE family translocator [Colwellia hornerae]TWX59265.1 LysE family translocator [Colwellia hornerae]TWX66151.1 LysE family translocator [Colwellia hornerae]
MEFHLWLSFVVICMMGALSPGPSLALVIKNTLAGGTPQGYATAISHGLGVALYAAITATGIAVIIVKSPLIFSIIQYAGAAFLLYLGVKSLLSKKDNEVFSEESTAKKSQVNGWRDGFLIAFLNPKLAIFFLALFSQFLAGDASSEQKVIMTATVGSIDALWYCLVTFTLSRGNIISKLRENSHIVDKVTGSFLILLAARIVIS